jgi:hypothetical protein
MGLQVANGKEFLQVYAGNLICKLKICKNMAKKTFGENGIILPAIE